MAQKLEGKPPEEATEAESQEKNIKKLNKIGKRILFELDSDSSQTLNEIGKKIRKSPQYVEYWINKLREEGYIKEFLTIIDYKKLGYNYYTFYISLRMISPEKLQKLFDYFSHDPSITFLYSCYGKWDLIIGFLAKDPLEVAEKIKGVKTKFSDTIGNLRVETHVGSVFLGRRHLLEGLEKSQLETFSSYPIVSATSPEKREIAEFDKKDLQILSVLKNNGRASTLELAEKSHLTPDIVRYRLKKLREKKVILRYTILPDYEKINWKLYRVLIKLRRTNPTRETELFNFFENQPQIIRYTKEFGTYDVAIDVEIYGNADLNKLIREMKAQFYDILSDLVILQVEKAEKSYYFLSV
ncbi:MAG: winged helix-turn-helix transcriptional regulator [Candidatus Micrarchaeia archaeon]